MLDLLLSPIVDAHAGDCDYLGRGYLAYSNVTAQGSRRQSKLLGCFGVSRSFVHMCTRQFDPWSIACLDISAVRRWQKVVHAGVEEFLLVGLFGLVLELLDKHLLQRRRRVEESVQPSDNVVEISFPRGICAEKFF